MVERQEQRNKELQNTLRELEGELSSKKDQWDRETQAKAELERQCTELTREFEKFSFVGILGFHVVK